MQNNKKLTCIIAGIVLLAAVVVIILLFSVSGKNNLQGNSAKVNPMLTNPTAAPAYLTPADSTKVLQMGAKGPQAE
jgi:flagellar basal body-associated protein FliL